MESCSKAARAKEIRAELDQILNEEIGSQAASVEKQSLADEEEMAADEHGLPLLDFEIIGKLSAIASADVETDIASGEIKPEEGQTVDQMKSAAIGSKLNTAVQKKTLSS